MVRVLDFVRCVRGGAAAPREEGPRHFHDLDRNGDGFIDESEAPAGRPPGR